MQVLKLTWACTVHTCVFTLGIWDVKQTSDTKQKNKTVKNVSATWRAIKIRCSNTVRKIYRRKERKNEIKIKHVHNPMYYNTNSSAALHAFSFTGMDGKYILKKNYIYLLRIAIWMYRFDLLMFTCVATKTNNRKINTEHNITYIYTINDVHTSLHIVQIAYWN